MTNKFYQLIFSILIICIAFLNTGAQKNENSHTYNYCIENKEFTKTFTNRWAVDPANDYYEGIVYAKVKDNVAIDITLDATKPLSQQRVSVLKDVIEYHQIYSIKHAFPELKNLEKIYKIEFSEGKLSEILQALHASNLFEYVEGLPVARQCLTPNDISTEQWYFDKISAPQAWDITTGSNNVVVAIIDDAVAISHSDLAGNIWQNNGEIPGDGIDNDNNGYVDDVNGWDVADNDNNPMPPSTASNIVFSHGTHCAGIISAVTNNNLGIAALGYNVKLMPVKCKTNNDTGVDLPYVYEGIAYAIANSADVINMAWSVYPYAVTLQILLQEAYNNGSVLVASGGNDGTVASTYPSSYPNVLGVGATDANDTREASSNFGGSIKVFAPGENIYSTVATNNNAYAAYSGSSPACAMVSALAALMKSYDPNASPKRIVKCIEQSLDDINAVNTFLLPGRINAEEALKCLNIPPFAYFTANDLTVEEIVICPGASVTFNDISVGPAINAWNWTFPGGTPSSSTAQNPTVTFNTPGTYEATLTVTSPFGTDSQSLTVEVGTPTAVLSGDTIIISGTGTVLYLELSGTPPFTVSYTNGTTVYTIDNIYENELEIPINPMVTGTAESQEYTYTLVSVTDSFCDVEISGSADILVLDIDPCVDCPYDYVQNTFLGGGCVNAFNVKFTGNLGSIGRFEQGPNLDIGFGAGIFMVTGNPSELLYGPNSAGGTSESLPPLGGNNCSNGTAGPDGDVDLNLLTPVGICTNDAIVLEFDFIPSTSNIKFNYVFASEEYPEFVCSPFNDVFGFFVSGPGINGPYTNNAVNIALIPDTNLPVLINSVNSYASTPSGYSSTACESIAYDDLHISNPLGSNTTEFDGYTVPLTARIFNLIPCEIYHIKLAVADASDEILDSGVFLQAKSFTGGGAPNVVAQGFLDQQTGLFATYEGCETAYFEVSRPDLDEIDEDVEIQFTLGGTAVEGEDYEAFSHTVVIPAGEVSVLIPIEVYQDFVEEGNETLILSLLNTTCDCSNIPISATLLLLDNVVINAGEDIIVCKGESVQLQAIPDNNVSYEWSNPQFLNNPNIPNPVATITETTTFGVQSVDEHGCLAEDNVTVYVVNPPNIPAIVTDTVICDGDLVSYQLTQLAPVLGYSYQWSPPDLLDDPNAPNPSILLNGEDVNLSLQITNQNGCDTTIQVLIHAQAIDIQTSLRDTTFCSGDTILLQAEEGFEKYIWSTGDTTSAINIYEAGTYELTVYNEVGCSTEASAVVTENPGVNPQIIGNTHFVYGDTVQLSLNNLFDYIEWSSGETTQSIVISQPGEYIVKVANEFGCEGLASIYVSADYIDPYYIPKAFTPNGDGVNDVFRVITDSERIVDLDLHIFDRWGNEVFSGQGLDTYWDGYYNSLKANMGVYVYYGHVTLVSGEKLQFVGNITLIR
ncbi:MAG: choice-of-anchor L domain-containing protein [Chitinophagales bacterium]|nr:choice-of-anchor L domain-containing protein [Bacteroidota bacterium]MCB9042606.1 choice-of-anchor L domain-containing protein [Chitinophagales bacterium]